MEIEFLAYISIRHKKKRCERLKIICSASKLKWDRIYSPGSSTELEGVTNQAAKRSKFMSVGSTRFVQKKS